MHRASYPLRWCAALWLLGAACDGPDPALLQGGDGAAPDAAAQTDASTDPDAAACDPDAAAMMPLDTDRDGIPNGVEVGLGFNPKDVDSPAPEQLVYLPEGSSSAVEHYVDVWIDGEDQIFTGRFEASGSPDALGHTAETFYAGSEAHSAQPPAEAMVTPR